MGELQTGGKRATIRSWKSYYTVLCGQLMCFFRDQEDFFESKAASSPIMIYQASVETANDYTKRNFVFRLHAPDGSEFLFGADSEEQQEEWVKKIKFHAGLPSQQLTSYKLSTRPPSKMWRQILSRCMQTSRHRDLTNPQSHRN